MTKIAKIFSKECFFFCDFNFKIFFSHSRETRKTNRYVRSDSSFGHAKAARARHQARGRRPRPGHGQRARKRRWSAHSIIYEAKLNPEQGEYGKQMEIQREDDTHLDGRPLSQEGREGPCGGAAAGAL